jgi:hypothetical protein
MKKQLVIAAATLALMLGGADLALAKSHADTSHAQQNYLNVPQLAANGDTGAGPPMLSSAPMQTSGSETIAHCLTVLKTPTHYAASEVAYCRSLPSG